MSGPPPSSSENRLLRCIRDLAAMNALPAMCIGRSPDEALEIVLDGLPTVLDCELLYLFVPGQPPAERACLDKAPVAPEKLAEVRAAIDQPSGELSCLEAEIPMRAGQGRLVIGRRRPLDLDIDRVLVRTAANLVGTTLDTANVLDAARRKDEFLAVLGHELRNPLAPILTAVELLGRHHAGLREKEVIERQTRHLARLVDDLLDISRVTRGHIELRNEQVTLASVLERAVEIAGPLIARRRHELRIAEAKDTLLQGDPVRLAQVFGNLLTNAAKFTPPGGKIDVDIVRTAGRVHVAVRDSGRGIDATQLRRIFEPFVQADRKQDALQGGLGLGLAIVANLVERHGGAVTVHSDGLGRGATFTVELPTVAKKEAAVEAPRELPRPQRDLFRVLVVDDNTDLAELMAEALETNGFRTAVAHDAYSAIERWRSFIPHAGILDVGLPQLDGYELARTLRAEHGTEPVLIAATGYGQPTDRVRAADAGFDRHFVKPVSVKELVAVLDERLAAPAA
jgi:signal transduction histidine kinase/ActR/RegA family two-component response regulator